MRGRGGMAEQVAVRSATAPGFPWARLSHQAIRSSRARLSPPRLREAFWATAEEPKEVLARRVTRPIARALILRVPPRQRSTTQALLPTASTKITILSTCGSTRRFSSSYFQQRPAKFQQFHHSLGSLWI